MVVSRWRERLNRNFWGCVSYYLRRNKNCTKIFFYVKPAVWESHLPMICPFLPLGHQNFPVACIQVNNARKEEFRRIIDLLSSPLDISLHLTSLRVGHLTSLRVSFQYQALCSSTKISRSLLTFCEHFWRRPEDSSVPIQIFVSVT